MNGSSALSPGDGSSLSDSGGVRPVATAGFGRRGAASRPAATNAAAAFPSAGAFAGAAGSSPPASGARSSGGDVGPAAEDPWPDGLWWDADEGSERPLTGRIGG
ncbi:hypothetical protein [Nocardia sp. NPDC057455]|uniref:hypothetical protein n=1 Tax=Nocardia sp. NPDC057455 TaxID=3346138 RepID=UPI00366F8BFB